MNYEDSFGFLNQNVSFSFEKFEIKPKPDFKEILSRLKQDINLDGFIYPPNIHRIQYPIDDFSKGKIIPNSRKPAELYRLPASHIIQIETSESVEKVRNNDAGFIIHFLSFLYGTKLQFHDWYFEGKTPVNVHGWFYTSPKIANQVLKLAYEFWLELDGNSKRIFTNCLYMHSKAICYEWDWEKFTMEYMVFDALYKLTISIYSDCPKAKTHPERLKIICDYYKICYKETTLNNIAKLRRELYHETLWDGNLPTSGQSHFSFYAPDHLHRLNDRIITSLIGYNNTFSKSNWEGLTQHLFD